MVNGIRETVIVKNQTEVWEQLERNKENGELFGLIVTDMHYPLRPGEKADHDAGFVLLEELKKRTIDIPVIICSSRNFTVPEAFGCVWYNQLNDIEYAFGEVLRSLQ